jgi:hypothetical protein
MTEVESYKNSKNGGLSNLHILLLCLMAGVVEYIELLSNNHKSKKPNHYYIGF